MIISVETVASFSLPSKLGKIILLLSIVFVSKSSSSICLYLIQVVEEPMAKNENCTTSDDGNADASSAHNENLRRLSRKRHISASAVESEETEIKRKRLNSATDGTVAVSNSIIQTKKSLDDLPLEMLEAVLQYMPTSDLLKCRQVNQKCNEVASRIMRERGDLQLHFSSATDDGQFVRTIQHRHCQELLVNICSPYGEASAKSLDELVVCLKVANHFPITSFRFDDLNQFGNDDMESFLSIWGTNIVALNISIKDIRRDVGVLRNLLVKTVPNLKELQINFGWERNPAVLELFADANEFQLPNLQVLRTDTNYRGNRPIIANILKAAPNLINFYQNCRSERWSMENDCVKDGITTDDLAMIQTLNKFHCLKDLRIELSEDLIRFLALKRIDFKLKSLDLSLQPSLWKNEQLKSSATSVLNQIFQSSKDVIQVLRIEPLGMLGPDLNIPRMKNLRKLGLFGIPFRFVSESEDAGIFSPPFEMAENFPNLKELTVRNLKETAVVFRTSQQMKPIPSIEVLRIIGKLSVECEQSLLKAAPNVTTLLIEENDMDRSNMNRVSINFQLIANCLPKLQSFGYLFIRSTHHDLLHSLDAAFTGLPVEFCEKNSKKFRNIPSLSADELPSYQLEQRNSSILDLKELKQFHVNYLFDGDTYFDMEMMDRWVECDCEDSDCGCGDFGHGRIVERDDESGFSPGDVLYKTGFSKVSKFLAFDLMPNLAVRTHRYLD